MLQFFLLFFGLFLFVRAESDELIEGADDLSETVRAPPSKPLWQPEVGEKWQIILNSTINLNSSAPLEPKNVKIFEVDLFDTPKATIDGLRKKGVKVICYFSATTSEDWRPDFASFKNEEKGACLPMWVGERYVDIRKPGVWDIMAKRIKMASEKGCDGIDPDNIDIFQNRHGFRRSITKRDTVTFFRRLADEAASYGISIGLKNAMTMLRDVRDHIQFAVNESCAAQRSCSQYANFISPPRYRGLLRRIFKQRSGKPVFHIEYTTESMRAGPVKKRAAITDAMADNRRRQCLEGNALGELFSTTIKALNLDGWVQYCDGESATTALKKGLVVKGLAKECKGGR